MILTLDNSTAMHLGEIIDCRYLTLAMEFRDWDRSQAQSLAIDALAWINDLLNENFIASWQINDRNVNTKMLHSQVRKMLQEATMCHLRFNAYWKSERINTQQQLRQWHSFVQRGACLMGWPQPGWSADFADYWNSHILPHAKDKTALKHALLKLFCEKKRHLLGVCYTPDIDGALFISPQNDAPHLCQGRILLYVSAFALGDRLSKTAEAWKEKMITFARKYRDLDGRVMLQPKAFAYASPRMTYFDDGQNQSQGYLPGIEWANILSPRTQQLLPWTLENGPKEESIQCVPLSNGALLLASHKTVTQYDIDDALLLKSWVKDALCPGPGLGYALSLILRPAHPQQANIRMPRKDWAIVPIGEEEIEIWGSQLCFRSNSD